MDCKKIVTNQYNEWYRDERKIYPESIAFRESILGAFEPKEGAYLLDVGCGEGLFLEIAQDRGFNCFGIDISLQAIKRSHNKVISNKACVDKAEHLPFFKDSFDYVVCLGSLEHISYIKQGLKEIKRVLKKDGKVLFHVPNLYFIGHIFMKLFYDAKPSEAGQGFSEILLSMKEWRNVFYTNGYMIESVKKYNDIWATKKVSKIVLFFWKIIKYFVPANISYCFQFICSKNG